MQVGSGLDPAFAGDRTGALPLTLRALCVLLGRWPLALGPNGTSLDHLPGSSGLVPGSAWLLSYLPSTPYFSPRSHFQRRCSARDLMPGVFLAAARALQGPLLPQLLLLFPWPPPSTLHLCPPGAHPLGLLSLQQQL